MLGSEDISFFISDNLILLPLLREDISLFPMHTQGMADESTLIFQLWGRIVEAAEKQVMSLICVVIVSNIDNTITKLLSMCQIHGHWLILASFSYVVNNLCCLQTGSHYLQVLHHTLNYYFHRVDHSQTSHSQMKQSRYIYVKEVYVCHFI